MEVIDELLDDQVYKRVLDKFSENGPFSYGVNYNINSYDENYDEEIPDGYKELCNYIDAIQYGWKLLSDIPNMYRTRELYTNTFDTRTTYQYIEENIGEFDREFFKDLIMTNEHALSNTYNCFSIMPLEYIDDEMISLAILCATEWSDTEWLEIVCERKKKAISEDVWKLIARLYGSVYHKEIVDMTPEEYKDEEWYLELFKCTFATECAIRIDQRDVHLNDDDRTLMDYIPQEVITPEFLIKVFLDDNRNICRFSEKAMEMEIPAAEDAKGNPIYMKFWQVALRTDGELIENIKLNRERVDYFLKLYGLEIKFRSRDAKVALLSAYRDQYKYAKNSNCEPIDNNKMIPLEMLIAPKEEDNISALKRHVCLLPVMNHADVPDNYDPTDYLAYVYSILGINVVNADDALYYEAILPEGLYISYSNTEGRLIDSENNTLIEFFHDDDINERNVYVKYINPSLMEQEEDRGIARTNRIKNTNN